MPSSKQTGANQAKILASFGFVVMHLITSRELRQQIACNTVISQSQISCINFFSCPHRRKNLFHRARKKFTASRFSALHPSILPARICGVIRSSLIALCISEMMPLRHFLIAINAPESSPMFTFNDDASSSSVIVSSDCDVSLISARIFLGRKRLKRSCSRYSREKLVNKLIEVFVGDGRRGELGCFKKADGNCVLGAPAVPLRVAEARDGLGPFAAELASALGITARMSGAESANASRSANGAITFDISALSELGCHGWKDDGPRMNVQHPVASDWVNPL